MNKVEIYVTNNNEHGLTPGYIYPVEEHIADSLTSNNSAKTVDYKSLNDIKTVIDNVSSEHNDAVQAVKDDFRLTEDGKKEKIEALEAEYHEQMTKYSDEYKNRISTLKEVAKEKTQFNSDDNKMDADTVRQESGLMLAKLDRAKLGDVVSMVESAELNQQVARELLSNWLQIKSVMLEKLSANPSLHERQGLNTTMSTLYNAIEKASTSDGQKSASDELRILDALENRGVYKPAKNDAKSLYDRLKQSGRIRR